MSQPTAPPLRIHYNRVNTVTGIVNEMQESAFQDVTTFLLFVEGGVGSGKSHEAVMKALKLSKLNAGVDGGILVPDYSMFKRDILSIFQKLARIHGFELGWNGHEHSFKFPWAKGAKVWVFSADTEFPGANLGWGVVNEYSIIPLDKIEEFVERRVRLACPFPQIELVGTPEDRYGWLEEYTAKWTADAADKGKDVRFVHGSSDMNSHNLRAGYVETMKGRLDPASFALWFGGKRVTVRPDSFYFSFGPWNQGPLRRRDGLVVHVGLDFNVGNMHAIMAHFPTDTGRKTMEVFHEIQLKNAAADTFQMGEAIKKWNHDSVRDLLITCDASGKARKTTGPSDAEALRSMGFTVRLGSHNPWMRDRQLRANGIFSNKRFKVDPKACPILVRDIVGVKQHKITLEKIKDPKGIYTHSSDAMDYLMDFEFPDIDLRGRKKFVIGNIHEEL